MKFKIKSKSLSVNVGRIISINEDVKLDVQNEIYLMEGKDGNWVCDIEEIDLCKIIIKDKEFVYEAFGRIKDYIKLIYNVDVNKIVDDNEYTMEEKNKLKKLICKRYRNVLKM